MDYFFQEQRWTDTFLSLHVKKFKRIILFLLIAFSAAGAKAADVPTSWKDVTFNENIRYSQWVINSRISDFYANQTQRGFYTYDKNGTETGKSKGDLAFDYVPGLVAKAVLEAYANYSTFDWSKPWFYSVMNYAKEKTYTLVATSKATNFSKITLDNMNACKMYFPLMETGALSTDAKSTGETAIANVLTDMKKYNDLYVIGNGSESGVKESTNETVKSMFGGWFHKPSYKDQMWCDGLYMGAALLAQIVNYKNSTTNVDKTSDWNLITKQFTISWNQLYDSKKGLLYHAFTANPKDAASSAWAGISNTEGSEVYHSEAFWGRAMGWYFLALVDVLEQMPSNNSNRATLIGYLEQLAAGLAQYQDGTGCWYQVVDQKDKALSGNYLESSCTSLFAAAYLKAVRLGFLTTNGTYDYKTIGVNAFKGAVNQFMKYDTFEPTGTTVQLVHNCASAGLGGDKKRSGSREYYITGGDVGQTNTYTEGKVMGAFIMAATEYERANEKAIRFSYDLAPTYTLEQGGSITAEALGSGDITYKWYNASNDSPVSDATLATFTPEKSGSYYCKATNGSTTIQTSTTAVTVSGTSNENVGSGTNKDIFSLTVTYNNAYNLASGADLNLTSAYANVTGGSALVHNGKSKAVDIIYLKNKSGNIALNGSSSSTYAKLTLDTPLQEGDVITFTSDESSIGSFYLTTTLPKNTNCPVNDGTYTVTSSDGLANSTVLYVWSNSNGKFKSITITRDYPESDSRATFTYGSSQLTFTETTEGTYTTTLEVGASKRGKDISITPSKKDGATIKQGETTVSGDITIITVPSTMGQTTTSTYTVTSKDGTSTTTYEINVKLVKENVVLVFSNGSTEWTWDKTTNSTKPTFTQPKLKAYLAETYGKEGVTPTEVTITSNITYLSDVTDVATVDENNGTITIQDDANGGAKIYAILKGNDYYNDAQTFFNIVVKQGYSYSVATDTEIKNGPDLNQSVYIKNGETKLVKMTFGGWKWNTFRDENDNNKLKSTYVVNKTSTRKDEWKNPITSDESVIASIDGYKTYISGYSDAVDESKKESDVAIYGSRRYGWFKPAKKRSSDNYLETYPYSLPVRGAYMTFEPTQNGTLTVYILQNGAWNTNRSGEYKGIKFNNGEIVAGEFRPHSFYICNQRGLNVDQFSPKTFNCTTKQKVKGSYYCDLENHKDDPKNIATWKEFSEYMSKEEQSKVAANWKSGINGAQKIVRLDNGSYLAIEKGIVKYTFFVTANETYYLFSNFSKLGFCGANFVPSETVKPKDDVDHKITLSDVSAYPKPTKVTDDTDADKIKYAWKFGNDIKGYVKGFTIPLFNSITLNRTFKPNQWTTLSLPFNLTQTEVEQIFGKGTQIIVFDKAETTPARTNLTFFYHEIQNVLPGYPYLIRPTLVDADGKQMVTKSESADYAPTYTITKDGDKLTLTEFTVYNKAINPAIEQHEFVYGDYKAKCTPSYCTADVSGNGNSNYSKQYKEGDIFVSEGDGTVYISGGQSYGKGYRSYIDYTGASTPAKALSISFSGVEDDDDNGTTTEIRVTELADDVIQTLGIGGVYNLNGQKVADTTRNLPAGIYIVNGRKVVVK